MKKRILVIIVILLVLILLLGGAFAYAYFFTDIFKSNKQIFLKYISQNEEIINLFNDENIKAYSEKQKNTPYTTNGTLKTNVTFADSTNQNMATALQNCNISFEGQVDNSNNFNHKTVKANYSDSQALTFELLQNNDVYAFKANDVVDKFIGIENKDLKALATKFGMDEETISKIPDKIDFEKIQNFRLFTDEEILQIKDKYMNVILNDLTDDMFSKEENSQSNVYVLTIDAKHEQKIFKDVLVVFKDDDILLNKIKTIMTQELNMSETDASQIIENMKQSIEKTVNENTESMDSTTDTEKLLIKVYINNKKLNKTEFIFKEETNNSNTTTDSTDAIPTPVNSNEEHKIIVEKIENGANIITQSDDLDKIGNLSIQKTTPANEIKYDITSSYGDEKLCDLSVRFFGINTDEVVETAELSIEGNLSNMFSRAIDTQNTYSYNEGNTSSSANKIVWTYNNTKKFTNQISREGIDTDNVLLINTAPSIESIQNTFTQLSNKFVQINNEKMAVVGIQSDRLNPFMYYIPGMIPMLATYSMRNIYNMAYTIPGGVVIGVGISVYENARTISNAREFSSQTDNDIYSNEENTTNPNYNDYNTETPASTTTNLSEEARNTFNAMYEAYQGERQGKSNVNALITLVNSSNASSEHKVEVEVVKLDGTKINGLENYTAEGNMYSIEMEKDTAGYINKIVITEVL